MPSSCRVQVNKFANILILSFAKSIFDSVTFILSILSNRGISFFTTSVFSGIFLSVILHGITTFFSENITFPLPNLNSVSAGNLCIFFLSSSHINFQHNISTILSHILSRCNQCLKLPN